MITILDPIFSEADKETIPIIKPALSYKGTWARPTKKKTIIESYNANVINKGLFLTGLIPRIKSRFPDIEIVGDLEKLKPTKKPHLKGITPREDQLRLVSGAIDQGRGVLLSPTGSGKTVVAMLLLSCFPKAKVLFLCHSLSIIKQTEKEFKKFGFTGIQVLGGGEKTFNRKKRITLSTIQTFVGIDKEEWFDFFDITICDECHHINSATSQYAKVLGSSLSPMRIGLTATLPTKPEGILYMEGYLGPVIGEVTVMEGVEKKMLAKPTVKLIPVPYNSFIGDLNKYTDIYKHGIVENRARNRIILEEAKSQIDQEKTALIMVKEISHGNNLVSMAKSLFSMDVIFVQGKTEGEVRTLIQQTLNEKIIRCVVCTAVWREGVNIKSLNTIILALGGKSAIQTAQALGRGLRMDKGKDEVLLVDMLDPYKYLAQHSVARISLYVNNNWM